MAAVIQYDENQLWNTVNDLQNDPDAFAKLVSFLRTGVTYDGGTNSIVALNKNIASTIGKNIKIAKNGANIHSLYINDGFVSDLTAKVPPRQG